MVKCWEMRKVYLKKNVYDGMNHELKNRLPIVFPHREKPKMISECQDETPAFNELLEEEVAPETFHCSDAFFWFTPEGFIYFFPALIRCSFEDFEKCVPAIEQVLDNFCDYFGSTYDSMQITRKWELFSVEQIEYILKWLQWIEGNYPFDENLKHAKESLLLMTSNS